MRTRVANRSTTQLLSRPWGLRPVLRELLPRLHATQHKGSAADPSRASDSLNREKYSNPLLRLAGLLLPNSSKGVLSNGKAASSVQQEHYESKKLRNLSIGSMREELERALSESPWFINGRAKRELFAEDKFVFTDPNVTITGLDGYCKGVARLFHPDTTADIIATEVISPNQVRVTWRLAARVQLGPFKPKLKPYVVTTDLTTGTDGLIVHQKDSFSIPNWEILLSVVLPSVGKPPAPPVTRG